jgi:peptidyl-tRNA hydrolase, PTH1 family
VFWKRKSREPELPPEWLIVGLGNPGPEYRGTRHNIGFEAIDDLASRHRIKVDRAKHRGMHGSGLVAGVAVVLAKPLTYMNLSGQAVAPLARQFGIKPDRILVIADDLDLALGKLRLKEKGSAGGHNGHKSLIASLGTQSYPRLKIGIGQSGGSTIDHVLSRFTAEERVDVEAAVKAAVDAVEALLRDGYQAAQEVLAAHNKRGG